MTYLYCSFVHNSPLIHLLSILHTLLQLRRSPRLQYRATPLQRRCRPSAPHLLRRSSIMHSCQAALGCTYSQTHASVLGHRMRLVFTCLAKYPLLFVPHRQHLVSRKRPSFQCPDHGLLGCHSSHPHHLRSYVDHQLELIVLSKFSTGLTDSRLCHLAYEVVIVVRCTPLPVLQWGRHSLPLVSRA